MMSLTICAGKGSRATSPRRLVERASLLTHGEIDTKYTAPARSSTWSSVARVPARSTPRFWPRPGGGRRDSFQRQSQADRRPGNTRRGSQGGRRHRCVVSTSRPPCPMAGGVICDDDLAPQGLCLPADNKRPRHLVKSCMFSGFKRESEYVARTVDRFRKLVGLEMRNPRPHGGAGNFRIPGIRVTRGITRSSASKRDSRTRSGVLACA